MASFELVHSPLAELAEGPVWHEKALWWVDIHAGTLNRWEPASGESSSRATGDSLGAACPCVDGRWILARRRGFAFLDWKSGEISPMASVDLPADQRLNDGKCDPSGRFWAGSMGEPPGQKNAFLFVLEENGRTRQVLDGISLSNGLAWSGDGNTMFHVDSLEQSLTAYEFRQADGTLGKGRLLACFPESMGCPDGIAIDRDDNLWVAMWGGSAVVRIDGQSGSILQKIDLPVRQPSSCCFGGARLDQLYVTSAWSGMDDAQRQRDPLAGSIFQIPTSTPGIATRLFQNSTTL
jgi:sugar lactone lactonase YvrE